jgi:hypothetical protein
VHETDHRLDLWMALTRVLFLLFRSICHTPSRVGLTRFGTVSLTNKHLSPSLGGECYRPPDPPPAIFCPPSSHLPLSVLKKSNHFLPCWGTISLFHAVAPHRTGTTSIDPVSSTSKKMAGGDDERGGEETYFGAPTQGSWGATPLTMDCEISSAGS